MFFKSTIQRFGGGEIADGVWEEIIIFVSAETECEALSKAVDVGKQKHGESYSSESGKVVWQFVAVERVVLVEDDMLMDGNELFSRYLRASEAESILKPFD